MFDLFRKNKLLLFSILFYFGIRLINLTKPPLFNDEAIYLDWGFREIHKPGYLYFSLYDGKVPLLMWIFGIMENFFNPAFSGRIISVIAGFLTLLGIYKISKSMFNERVAIFSTIFYCVIPLFSFYDRQALMESSIAAVGVWSFYFLQKILEEKKLKYPIALGVVLGIGVFIKTTAFIFLICSFLLIFIKHFQSRKKLNLPYKTFIIITSFFLSVFLLVINPSFWSSLSSNSRYVLTLSDLITFPFATWLNSIFGNLQIAFFYLTPLVFICFLIGLLLLNSKKLFLSFFLLALLIETFTVRNISLRYIFPFLPFTVIPVAYLIVEALKKRKVYGNILFVILFVIPFALTLFQVLNQPKYLIFTSKFTPYYPSDYLYSFSSGYGVDETIQYIKNFSNGKNINVSFAENAGNPETAILVTFVKDKHIQPAYLDSQLISSDLSNYSCLNTPKPLLFIARDNQQGGLDKFLEKVETIKNPYGKNTIGIYQIKKDCSGKTLYLTPQENSNF